MLERTKVNNASDMTGFAKGAERFAQVAQMASKDPVHRAKQQAEAYTNRWSNLVFSLVFVLVLGGGLWLVYGERARMGSVTYYLLIAVIGGLLLIGLLTFFYYCYLVIRGLIQ